jgi:hypothetical protein
VAIGQAAKGNPWIFEQVLGKNSRPGIEDRIEICRRHMGLYLEWTRDERRSVLEMRKHACWYLKGFSGAAEFRRRLAHVTDVESFNELLDCAPSCKDSDAQRRTGGFQGGADAL